MAESDWSTLLPDPLNPNRYVLTHEDQDWVRSIVDLPGAEPVPWVVPQKGSPKGRVEEHHIGRTIPSCQLPELAESCCQRPA